MLCLLEYIQFNGIFLGCIPAPSVFTCFQKEGAAPNQIVQSLSDKQCLMSTLNTTQMLVIPDAIFTQGKKHAAASKLAQSNRILLKSQLESCLPPHPLPPAITRTEFGSNHNSSDTISARVYPSQGLYKGGRVYYWTCVVFGKDHCGIGWDFGRKLWNMVL